MTAGAAAGTRSTTTPIPAHQRIGLPLLAVLAGAAQAMSLATPWNGWPAWGLQLLALAVLPALLLRARSARHAAALGWLFATSWLGTTFGWLFTAMHTYGGLPAALALLAVLALAGFLALYWGAVCGVFWQFRHTTPAFAAIVFGANVLLAELARAQWLTGFPWGSPGYAHVDGPLAAYAQWIGVYGMGAIAGTLAAALALLALQLRDALGLRRDAASHSLVQAASGAQADADAHTRAVAPQCTRAWARQALPPSLLALLLGGVLPQVLNALPATTDGPHHSAGTLSLTLLQGNIPQDEKFQPGTGVALAMGWYGQTLREANTQLVVAPETALPLLPYEMPPGYWQALAAHFQRPDSPTAAVLGIPLGSFEAGYTNSVIGLAPGQPPGHEYRYDKHHLVPFGEFIPPLFKWFVRLMNIPLGDFSRGAVPQPSFAFAGQRIAPNVCYEDLFGEELAARFIDPASAPTLLVNVSNLAWFGHGQAIDQHLHISRLRTLELARPMVRATNTGATVVIDHNARIVAELPRATRGRLLAEAEGRTRITPYAWLAARTGLWPWWAVGLLVLGLGWLRRGRPRR